MGTPQIEPARRFLKSGDKRGRQALGPDERLATLIEVNRQLIGTLAPEESLRLLVAAAMRLFSAEACSIALVDEEEREVVFPAVGGELEGTEIRVPLGQGIVGWVIEHGQAVTSNDAALDPRFFSGVDRRTGFETRSILCAPLTSGSTVIGAIEVLNTDKAGGFDGRDLALLEALSGVAATAISRGRAVARLRTANQALRSDADARYELILGSSARMAAAVETLRAAARSRSTVLLLGESGVGKEVLARAVHRWSDRAEGPFVAVNCGALSPELLESELFGHERGAFTGAVALKKGRFELAQGGTIFLDEIGELEARLQSKLLRVLQERELQRVGGSRDLHVDVRVVAATNRDLQAAMAERSFRRDLYYRLAVVSVRVPALRERREDVLPLAEHLLSRFARDLGRPTPSFDDEAIGLLTSHDWPGNVRELSNAIERAVALSRSPVIHAEDLGIDSGPPASLTQADPYADLPLGEALEAYKRRRVRLALRSAGGSQTLAAQMLGLRQSNLSRLMKSLGLR